MLNEFLTHILQVIIVLDVAGVIAWFVLASRRRRSQPAMGATDVATVAGPTTSASLWSKLTGPGRTAELAPARAGAGNINDALQQLRRVLDSYRCSLG